jgi:pyrroloquinoline quinone biosynthesis protein B
VLTDAELDHTAGLLLLREGTGFAIVSTPLVRRWLNRHLSVGAILAERPWLDLPLDQALELLLPDGSGSGLQVRAFELDRHVPRFIAENPQEAVGAVVGLHVEDVNTGGKLMYAPCLAQVDEGVTTECVGADALLVDGTFWSEEEPVRMGIGSRTASQMGHVPVHGPQGSLAWLAELPVRRRLYVHINNTNPMLNDGSREAALVRDHGVSVAADGDMFDL